MANMSSYPWFRYYSETIKDKKIDLITEESGLGFLNTIGAWSLLLCMANDSPIRGSLYVTLQKRYTNEYIFKTLRLSKEDGEKLINLFIDYDMIDIDENQAYRIKNWDKRQFKSDFSNERVNKYRKKKKEEQQRDEIEDDETLHVTFHSVSASVSDSDSESLINSLNNESENNEQQTEFDNIQQILEKIVGFPPTGEAGIKAINEIIEMGAIEEDINNGFKWCQENGKTVRYYSQLVGPTRTSMIMRKQQARNPIMHETTIEESSDKTSDPLDRFKNSIEKKYFKDMDKILGIPEGVKNDS